MKLKDCSLYLHSLGLVATIAGTFTMVSALHAADATSVGAMTRTPGRAAAALGAREIRAEAEGPVRIEVSGGEAEVRTSGGTAAVITGDRIELPSRRSVAIPADADQVKIRVAADRLHAEADGKTLLDAPLPSTR